MTPIKKRFKFKFACKTAEASVSGDGEVVGADIITAHEVALRGVRKDIGPNAEITSIREVPNRSKKP
jgi:hypothetical protein